MTNSNTIPLHIFEVLEEEYLAIHGTPYEKLEVQLSDPDSADGSSPVTAMREWDFDESHIKNALTFAALLTSASQDISESQKRRAAAYDLNPDNWASQKLREYLWLKFKDETKTALLQASESGSVRILISQELNDLLKDSALFSEERFSIYWLSEATKELKASRPSKGFSGDDLKHFNRLLLEDAFPHCLFRIHNIRLAAIYKVTHQKKPSALSLSGGGIRSGTFALGLLQGFARHDLLNKFHYLSTVSGGGYIGSWLAAWIHRHPKGLKGVTSELANTTPLNKIDPDPDPIRYLRRYSNFITPKVGLLSADTWTFLGIYLRNLFLNWIVFFPFLLAALLLPRIIVTLTLPQPKNKIQPLFTLNIFGMVLDVFGRRLFLLGGFLLTSWALAYIIFNRPTLRNRIRQNSPFWRSRTDQRSFISWCLLPLVLAALFLTTYWAWSSVESVPKRWNDFFYFGLAVCLLAWLIASYILGRAKPEFIWHNWRKVGTIELIALLLAGIAGGTVLWLLTLLIKPINTEAGFWWDYWTDGRWLDWQTELYACLAVPAFMFVFLLGATLFIGGSSASPRIDDEDREWWARLSAWVLIAILGWTAFSALVIFGPIALLNAPKIVASIGGLAGIAAAILGRSVKTPGASKSQNQGPAGKGGIFAAISGKLLPLLAIVFIVILLVSLSLITTGIIQQLALLANAYPKSPVNNYLSNVADGGFDSYMKYIYYNVVGRDEFERAKVAHMNVLHHTSLWFVLALGIGLLVFGRFVSRLMNLNIFSLHGGYRSRLIRAFLGASRPEHQRKPNPFTGFDPADNISVHELRVGLFDETDFPDPVALANEFQNQNNATSKRLSDLKLLGNLELIVNKADPSDKLIAALRRDLNGALEDERLFPNDQVDHNISLISRNRKLLAEAYPELILPDGAVEPYRLMPLINTTLNLVGGDNLAWQQRKAEPFSITPLHSGCFRLGYRNSRLYGGSDTGGISIGTSAAISGAAASSNMGYYTTSPVLSLVLTFFNVRLGWWLGNPGPAGNETFELRAPRYSVKPILDEALGMTDDRNKYVYLTDGGHFENLGLFEMVLRRCHLIVVSDAAADAEFRFGDLGNAIRKVRIDLGIPIEFPDAPIFNPEKPNTGIYWAVGQIRYSCIDGPNTDGYLLYIKPTVLGIEPRDVLEYKKSHPAFPHQSTADQFFDEPQFESYRILGSHIMDRLCDAKDKELKTGAQKLGLQTRGLNLDDVFEYARRVSPEAPASPSSSDDET
jgi:hypothetical protein